MNNKLKRVAGYLWCNSVVTLWGCCPWAAYGAAAERTGQKQGQTDRRYSCRTWRCWHHSQTKTCAAVRLQSTRWRSWRNKQKHTKHTKKENPPPKPSKSSSTQEMNLWIKEMCWQPAVCWLLPGAAELMQWINDFFSILLHLFQPLPPFITASLLCYSGWQKGNKL